MVRINLIVPTKLADQHLIAEYNEILMLLGYVRKYPSKEDIPKDYCLGRGHIKFFKDKLLYLKKRHETIKKEMIKRGFTPTKKVILLDYSPTLRNDWKPKAADYKLIKVRLSEKISKKPSYYRYYGENKDVTFFLDLLN